MTFGVVMLAHEALHRATQVARHWARHGCPVSIHVDRDADPVEFADMRAALAGLADVTVVPQRKVSWGSWSLVAATKDAARDLVSRRSDISHVLLASGSCLPLRPVKAMARYLASHAETDFIESVTTADVPWAVGGLESERFTLRFPFNWKTQRRLFDAYVALQRRLKVKRRVPSGLVPHLGSQWWCLTRTTLAAILDDPDSARIDRYFRRVWIPDESYFQTMARRHAKQIESRSLTLAKFDHQGKPHVFYDDHLQLIAQSDCYVVRKIWPHANELYTRLLNDDAPLAGPAPTRAPGQIDRVFSRALDRRVTGRDGLYMQSRFPDPSSIARKTAGPYFLFQGFSDVLADFAPWLTKATGVRAQGRLFAPDRANFAGEETMIAGALTDNPKLRDYNPAAFLTSAIWNLRGEPVCFDFGPEDNQALTGFWADDVNAHLKIISGAFLVRLFRTGRPAADLRAEAARLQRIETEHIRILKGARVRASVSIWTLSDFVDLRQKILPEIAASIAGASGQRAVDPPALADLKGFSEFVQSLKNFGMSPTLIGDYRLLADWEHAQRAEARKVS